VTSRRSFVGAVAATMLVLPQAGIAQQTGRVYRIGFLGLASASASVTLRRIEAFRTGLRALGYVEGNNVIIDFRWAEGDADRLAELAGDLIRRRVDVLVTQGSTTTRVAKEATSTVPIVMLAVGDAVGAGLVASLSRPGGNVTGSTFLGQQIYAKQLELLKEAIPSVARVAVLMNPDNPANQPVLQGMEAVARRTKVVLTEIDARGPAEFEGAFRAMSQHRVDACVVSADAVLTTNARAIANLAVRHRLPATSAWSDFTAAGGLLSYGANIYDLYGRAAPRFVDKILKGAKPADLPVEQPTKFDLVINLKTAKALGIAIPQSLLLRADEVIR
jgi:putative tryptophan/tyrosine transport system substrate-binding protein